MQSFFFLVWIGGFFAAYGANRTNGGGRISSAFDAIFWPGELGFYIAQTYYRNRDWGK